MNRFRDSGARGRTRPPVLGPLAVLVLGLLTPVGGPLSAQGVGADSRIGQAAALQAAGDLAGAEALLLDAAEDAPESVPVLLALEGLLGEADALVRILPVLDGHLEARPRSTAGRTIQLRVLSELSRTAEIETAIGEWIRADSLSPEPYLAGSEAYAALGDEVGASALLEEGHRTISDPAAVALALFDRLGRDATLTARAELLTEVATDRPEDGGLVAERIGTMTPADRDQVVGAVIRAVQRYDDPAHGLLAVQVASVAAQTEVALAAARRADARLVGGEARDFLTQVSRIARDAGDPSLSGWALDRLRARADEDRADRRLQAEEERLAAGALASGDTARAMEARQRILGALDPGTEERRRALASWLRLAVLAGDADEALAGLEELAQSFPDAPELDELSARVARRLVLEGRETESPEVLRGIEGPLVLREQGLLLLLAGEVESSVEALITAAPGLPPDQATRALEVVTLLKRLEGDDARTVGRGYALAHYDRAADALDLLMVRAGETEPDAAAPLRAEAARIAEVAGRPQLAMDMRRTIVSDHAEAREWPESALRLARALADSPSGVSEARTLLERLVLTHPDHPLTADARRALERLNGRQNP